MSLSKVASKLFWNPDALSKKRVAKLLWESKCGKIRAYEVYFSKQFQDPEANGEHRHETNEELAARVERGEGGQGSIKWEWLGWSYSGERAWIPTDVGAAPVYLRMLRELADPDIDWSSFGLQPEDTDNTNNEDN